MTLVSESRSDDVGSDADGPWRLAPEGDPREPTERRSPPTSTSPHPPSFREQWYFGLLKDGSVPGALINYNPQHSKKISRPNTAYTYSLTADARERFPRLRFELSDIMLEDFVTDKDWPKAKKYRDAHRNGWTFEPLAESRAAWDQRYGPQQWNNVEEWG